jgi:hypothetical protein
LAAHLDDPPPLLGLSAAHAPALVRTFPFWATAICRVNLYDERWQRRLDTAGANS